MSCKNAHACTFQERKLRQIYADVQVDLAELVSYFYKGGTKNCQFMS